MNPQDGNTSRALLKQKQISLLFCIFGIGQIVLSRFFSEQSALSPATAIFCTGLSLLLYGCAYFVAPTSKRILWMIAVLLLIISFVVFLIFLFTQKQTL